MAELKNLIHSIVYLIYYSLSTQENKHNEIFSIYQDMNKRNEHKHIKSKREK